MKIILNVLFFIFKGDHLLVIGGQTDPGTHTRLSDIELLTFDENYNECNVPDLDEPVCNHASVTSSRGVITCGGLRNVTSSSKCAILYSGETSSFPSMVKKRSDFGIVNVNETLYSIGGESYNLKFPSYNTMETINLKNGTEWTLEEIPFSAADHCTLTIGYKIYVVGGNFGRMGKIV